MLFGTIYPVRDRPVRHVSPSRHHTTLFARNREHAEELIARRGLAEALDPGPYGTTRPWLCSELLRQGEFAKATHAGCWLSMIAVASGTRDGFQLLCDDGMMHEVTHFADALTTGHTRDSLIRHPQFSGLVQNVMQLEQDVPGMFPLAAEDFHDRRLPRWHPAYDHAADIEINRATAYKAGYFNEAMQKMVVAVRVSADEALAASKELDALRKQYAAASMDMLKKQYATATGGSGGAGSSMRGKAANFVMTDDAVAMADGFLITRTKNRYKVTRDTAMLDMLGKKHAQATQMRIEPGSLTATTKGGPAAVTMTVALKNLRGSYADDAAIKAYIEKDRLATSMLEKMNAGGIMGSPEDFKSDGAFALRDYRRHRKWIAPNLYGPVMKSRMLATFAFGVV